MVRPVVNKGISLIEVLISLFIFSIAMLSCGLMVLKGLTLARDGLYQTKAAALVQMQHEAILFRGVTDTSAWQKRVAAQLPQGEGFITQESGVIRIQVLWKSSFLKKTQKESISIDFVALDD